MKRLDQFDYEELGASEWWNVEGAADVLTSFEMEVKGYFQRDDCDAVFSRLHSRYYGYVVNLICVWDLPFILVYDPEERFICEVYEVDHSELAIGPKNGIKINVLIECIETHNKYKIDIVKLKRFLSGDEVPQQESNHVIAMIPTVDVLELPMLKVLPNRGVPVFGSHKSTQQYIDDGECFSPVSVIGSSDNSHYRFEKTDKGWNIEYGDAVLVGVKDWLGMTYIKTLLENPGVKIGVLDLQRLAGDSGNGDQQNYEQGDYGDEDADSASGGGVAAWETIDSTARGTYRNRLEVIAVEIKDARKAGNKTKVAALVEEAEFIRKELHQSSFKPKDPEIDKNRKRVTKAINDTMKNIGKLEGLCNYNDKPISGHLSRSIQTGSYCSYTVSVDKLPDWRF